MALRDDRQAERVGHALPVRLAVACEREHRLDQALELQGRPHLAAEACRGVAGVPELVAVPGSTVTVSPASATICSPPALKTIVPSSTSKTSVW
jgi:hypothetical protein